MSFFSGMFKCVYMYQATELHCIIIAANHSHNSYSAECSVQPKVWGRLNTLYRIQLCILKHVLVLCIQSIHLSCSLCASTVCTYTCCVLLKTCIWVEQTVCSKYVVLLYTLCILSMHLCSCVVSWAEQRATGNRIANLARLSLQPAKGESVSYFLDIIHI